MLSLGKSLFLMLVSSLMVRHNSVDADAVHHSNNSMTKVQEMTCDVLTAICFHVGFLFCLFFDLEDEGDMFLGNVG
jgi:hypothetical protein